MLQQEADVQVPFYEFDNRLAALDIIKMLTPVDAAKVRFESLEQLTTALEVLTGSHALTAPEIWRNRQAIKEALELYSAQVATHSRIESLLRSVLIEE